MATTNSNFISELRRIFWPIEWHENKKFIPMALMMSCILFNFATLRSVKDGLVVTHIGAESVSFVKTYFVIPSAIIMMMIYAQLCNVLSQKNIFYTVTSFFLVFFTLFTFVFYPNTESFHLTPEAIDDGVIGKIKDDDEIEIDANNGKLNIFIDISKRKNFSLCSTKSNSSFGRNIFKTLRVHSVSSEKGGGIKLIE